MIRTDCILSIMYIVLLGYVLYSINKFQIDKLERDSKPINRVHFYIARDKNSELLLYMSKPFRGIDRFHPHLNGCIITNEDDFSNFGLNKDNFDNLKWKDDPIEVFINIKD